jgi:PGF-pre-PGF domain-containing protein
MKVNRPGLLLLALLVMSIPLVHTMEDMPGVVKGYVKDATTSVPIGSATVEVYNQTTSKSTTTASDGIYMVKMPQGPYSVTVSKEGYVSQTKSVTLTSGEYSYLDFNLNSADIDDGDGDGYNYSLDCNDSDASINPGSTEVCDGADNNCDGNVDEGFDSDGDGYTICGGDCDDTNANVKPGATEVCDEMDNNCDSNVDEGVKSIYYQDADGDGYGNPFLTTQACSAPLGYISNNTDCNDANASIYPSAAEVCGDGIDQNCDGVDMECSCADGDGDGYSDITCGGSDCNDANASINPEADETPYDGIDQDCDGHDLVDWDGDGYNYSLDCNDTDAGVNPGVNETCDGEDNDCDGEIDEGCQQTPNGNEAKGGGGGGGGGSGAAKGTVVKEIEAGSWGRAVFDIKDTGYVSGIVLNSKEAVYNVKVVVEKMDRKPYPTMPDPEGVVLSYLKISKTGITNTQLQEAEVRFQVPVPWLAANDIGQSRVFLRRDALGDWEALPTTYLSEDGEYAYYSALTPGFSYFVITGEGGSGYVKPEDTAVKTSVEKPYSQKTEAPVEVGRATLETPPSRTTPPPVDTVAQEAIEEGTFAEEKTGICGPSIVSALALVPVFFRRKR